MPKGKKGPTPDALDETPQEQAPLEPVLTAYHCEQDGCGVRGTFEEWTEHSSATGHTSLVQKPIEAQKPAKEEQDGQLFSEPGPVIRHLRAQLSEARRHELNQELADIYRQMIEQKEAAELAKERAKGFEAEMLPFAAKLRDPYEVTAVQCRWEIRDANVKELVRLDTNEVLETAPLSEEDRARELETVQTVNAG